MIRCEFQPYAGRLRAYGRAYKSVRDCADLICEEELPEAIAKQPNWQIQQNMEIAEAATWRRTFKRCSTGKYT